MRKGRFLTLVLAALLHVGAAFAALVDPAKLPEADKRALEDGDIELSTLTEERLAALRLPFDWRMAALTDSERSDLVLAGCRLEPTGLVPCLPDKTPLSGLQAQARRGKRASRHRALERVSALLASQDPNKPLSPSAKGYVASVAAQNPGALPASLVQAASAPGANAGDVAGKFEQAYLDSTRFFDGRLTLAEASANAVPLPPGGKATVPGDFYDHHERAVSDSLTRAALKRLNSNPVGAELVKAFPNGLPPIVVLPIESGAEAFYHDGRIVLSQHSVLELLTEGLPPAKSAAERSKLARPGALAARLASDPAARAKVLDAHESTIAHELAHGRQERRDRFWREQDRGNVLAANYAEEEHEAFLTELRYLHAKLFADPNASMPDADLERYESLLTDPDAWRENITREYMESWPDGAADLASAREVSRLREKAAGKLAKGASWQDAAIQALKITGFKLGDAELDAYEVEQRSRLDAFRKNELPAMRKQSPLVLARAWKAKAAREKDPLTKRHALETALEHERRAKEAGLLP